MPTLDDVFTKPAPPDTYLGVAKGMMSGVNVLAKDEAAGLALALVAAHTLECALKAYLSRDGDDRPVKAPGLRHDIEKLWMNARSEGLPIGDIPPWAANLSRIHGTPYYLRYSTGIHGILLPAPEPMATELAEIISTVSQCIR